MNDQREHPSSSPPLYVRLSRKLNLCNRHYQKRKIVCTCVLALLNHRAVARWFGDCARCACMNLLTYLLTRSLTYLLACSLS